jgi:hypothetical protein
MLRRLLINGLLSALLLGGWSGAFAVVLCPHERAASDAAGTHDCCRALSTKKAAQQAGSHCRKQAETAKGSHEAHKAQSLRVTHAHDAQSPHAPERSLQVSRETASGAQERRPGGGLMRESQSAVSVVQAPGDCAHCVGRSEHGSAPAKARGGEGSRRDELYQEPRAQRASSFSLASFAPAIIPLQGAPPFASRRHVLLNVFLI